MKKIVTVLFLIGATCGALIACGESKPAQDPTGAAPSSTDSMSMPAGSSMPASTGTSTAMPPMSGMDGGGMPPGHKM